MLVIFLVSLFGLILLGVPIAFSLIGSAFSMMLGIGHISALKLAQTFITGCDSVPLLAIPFFMIAGEIMNEGGISKRIVVFANTLLGHLKGGLGYVGIVASMIFAGISGSAVADTTAVGSVVLPIMEDSGYDKTESTALLCAAGCIGPIIPPSTQMIIYGVIAEVSIAKLFLGGIIPGLLIGLGLMLLWHHYTVVGEFPVGPKASKKEVLHAFREAFLAILLPFFIIFCIVSGIATATETAAIAVVYALIVSMFVYKDMKLDKIPAVVEKACIGTAVMMLVVGSASVAAYVVTIAKIPELLAASLLSLTDNVKVLMFLLNILLVLVGCVMDSGPAIMILTPILMPVTKAFGLDPVYIGVVMVCNLCIGLATPPVGNVLYVGVGLGQVKLVDLIRKIIPFVSVMFAVLFIITYFPQLILFIPNHF